MRAFLIGAVLFAACTTPSSTATPTPSSAPTVTVGATPTSVATQTPFPTSTFAVDPSAQWPVVLYEGQGFVVRRLTESAATEIARPCGPIARLEARAPGLLVTCRTESSDYAELRLISIPDGRVVVLASGVHPTWNADISPDGRSVAAFRKGDCVSPAPVCQTRAVLIDVASKSERELLASGYHLGATLEWTSLGLTLFQPECAEAGCVGPGDKSGTFIWDGSAFKKWSDFRFVARSGDWTLLERMRSFAEDARTVIVRGAQGERAVSAGHALSISDNGEALVWITGERLVRFAADGRILWQANFTAILLKTLGPDALLVVPPTGALELYDLKRSLRFPLDTGSVIAGVPR